jgi:hypothetical protein
MPLYGHHAQLDNRCLGSTHRAAQARKDETTEVYVPPRSSLGADHT